MAQLLAGYAAGDRVELRGLARAAEHNGKFGSVTGVRDGRLRVFLYGGGRTLAIKPANLTRLGGAADPSGAALLDHARLLFNQDGPNCPRMPNAISLVRRSCAAGCAQALFELAHFHASGELAVFGVPEDQARAVSLWSQGAALGHAGCQATLGCRYATGRGVAMNEAEGFRFYSLAAAQDDIGGMYGVGICYLNGEGVERDLDQAEDWLRRAHEQVRRSDDDDANAKSYEEDIADALMSITSEKTGQPVMGIKVNGRLVRMYQ